MLTQTSILFTEATREGMYRFNQVVVRNLGEQVVDNMSANVMVNVVDPAIISVNSGQASSHVVPLLFIQNAVMSLTSLT